MAQIGIGIGLPFGGRLVHPKWALALKTLDFPVNTTQTVIFVENTPIADARNGIVEMALENNVRYLFFLDDDVIIPRPTVQALGYILDSQIDEGVMAATGVYCTKTVAPAPVIYKDDIPGAYWDWRVNDIFEVDSCGAGCLLINCEVFKHLEKPYFKDESGYIEGSDGNPLYSIVSEDIYFCRKLRKAGFKIKAHGSVLCAHYDEPTKKFYTLPEDSLPYKKELARQEQEKEKKNG